MNKFHKIISIIFNPGIVSVLVLLLAVLFSFPSNTDRLIWTIAILGICFGAPLGYYLVLRSRDAVDTDVKDPIKRESLFKVSILSLLSAYVVVLFFAQVPILHDVLLAAILIHIVFIVVLDIWKWELSFHIGALALMVVFLIYYVSLAYLWFGALALILTALSRYKLKMHTIPQLIAGFLVSVGLYVVILFS